eukprot:9783572-Karenia_brevis.AAC.1
MAIAGLMRPGQQEAAFADNLAATVQALMDELDEPESSQVQAMVAEARDASAVQFRRRCNGETGEHGMAPRAQWTSIAPDDLVQPAGGPEVGLGVEGEVGEEGTP